MRFNITLLQIYKPFSFTHITIWFNLSIQMMNQKMKILNFKEIRVFFTAHRITRRDIDNTHRVNGIS